MKKSSESMTIHVIRGQRRSKVVGLTSINNRLFVLRTPSKQQIEVYDTTTFKLRRKETVRVEDLDDDTLCSGLTSCETNKCLYVSDYWKDTVYKIQLTDDGNEVVKWSVGRRPQRLSVNAACNLIVTCYCDTKIQEYDTTNGSLVREILLQSNDGEWIHFTRYN
jgi:hypothetical protein